MESRLVKDDDWKDSLFILRKEGDTEMITFPKNVESFADNLLMISLVRVAVLNKWTIQLSTKELDTKVFDSAENAFFAGFVGAACQGKTGAYQKGTTRFSKGIAAFQTFSVESELGKVTWLRTGGLDNLLARLSGMKGFTKDYWSLRGTIAAIFRLIKPVTVTDLKTYFLPKSEVMKHIKTKLPYNNGGIFRSEEIAYLSAGYSSTESDLNDFLMKLDKPTEEFVKNFSKEYAPIKTKIEAAERTIKLIAVSRSKVLFPEGKKKGTTKFKKLPLEDKIDIVKEDKVQLFEPESLPGIKIETESKENIGSVKWRTVAYKTAYTNPLAREVIDSWYIKFASEEDD